MKSTEDPRKQHSEVDVAVIGSGIGGLSAAALLASRGHSVTVCESHTTAGGAAHGFERDGFHFESGPSLFTGLSVEPSANPLRMVLDQLSDPFLRRLCDFDAFSLSGMDAGGTPLAEMHFMFRERFKASIDYPIGGSQAVANALVRGLEKHGGELLLGAHVDSVIVEEGRAVGIALRRGGTLRARRAVISNAPVWNTMALLPKAAVPDVYRAESESAPQADSIVHLHLGIDATGLPEDLDIHHVVLKSWDVTAPQNMCNISIPSTLDPAMAPDGHHAVHAYTAGNEPYEIWQGLKRGSAEYQAMKQERAEVLWQAMEKVIPDVRRRTKLALIGTPLTHERFLRRHRGTYGAAHRADEGRVFPGAATPLPGFFCCGDSTLPGIGVPAVAMSGLFTAGAVDAAS